MEFWKQQTLGIHRQRICCAGVRDPRSYHRRYQRTGTRAEQLYAFLLSLTRDGTVQACSHMYILIPDDFPGSTPASTDLHSSDSLRIPFCIVRHASKWRVLQGWKARAEPRRPSTPYCTGVRLVILSAQNWRRIQRAMSTSNILQH